jgi:hypothetical protein
MIKFIRTFLFNRKFPPAFTKDRCHVCERHFHNRDHVFMLRDEALKLHAVCAGMECVWEMAKRSKRTYRHVSSVPYLVAKGLTRWTPDH